LGRSRATEIAVQHDASYGPIAIMLAAVLLGALLLGIGIYVRGSNRRGSPMLGVLYAIVVVSPVAAGTAYFIHGLGRDLTQPSPHLYRSEGSPPAVQSGAVPVR
jgi:hypothetical protein